MITAVALTGADATLTVVGTVPTPTGPAGLGAPTPTVGVAAAPVNVLLPGRRSLFRIFLRIPSSPSAKEEIT